MFNVGPGEVLVIALIALIVLGPQRLPGAARQAGKVMGDLRRMSTGFQSEMRSAMSEVEDPSRTAARRNPLAVEPFTRIPEADTPIAAAIQSVSEQPAAPAKRAPLRAQPVAKRAPAKKKAPAKKTAVAKASPVKKAASVNKTSAKKVTSVKKKAAKPSSVAQRAPRRRPG